MSDLDHNNGLSLSATEEEFFRAGALLEEQDTFADLDEDVRQPSLWSRLFGRKTAQL